MHLIYRKPQSRQTARHSKTRILYRKEFAERFFELHIGWGAFSHLDEGHSEIYSFLSVWKCANRQIRQFEEQVFGAGLIENPVYFQHRQLMLNYSKDMADKLTDCMVAVIRDPISHFLSGYNQIEYRIGVKNKEPRERLAKAWPFGNQPVGSVDRFEQFVADLVTCPIGKNLPGVVEEHPNNLEMEHIYSMTSILRLIAEDPYIDNSDINFHYLPSLANLKELWAPFVLSSCPRSFSNETKAKFVTTPMVTESAQHASSDDPLGSYKAAKMAMKKEGPVSKALCALHLMDYACFRNLPDGVPKLCIDLYMDYYKRDLLLF